MDEMDDLDVVTDVVTSRRVTRAARRRRSAWSLCQCATGAVTEDETRNAVAAGVGLLRPLSCMRKRAALMCLYAQRLERNGRGDEYTDELAHDFAEQMLGLRH
jgi:hypothetical protein